MRQLQAFTAQAIRAEAAAQGRSIKDVAAAAGLNYKTLLRALDCERDLNFEQFEQIAGALGMAPLQLMAQAAERRAAATDAELAATIISAAKGVGHTGKITQTDADVISFLSVASSQDTSGD